MSDQFLGFGSKQVQARTFQGPPSISFFKQASWDRIPSLAPLFKLLPKPPLLIKHPFEPSRILPAISEADCNRSRASLARPFPDHAGLAESFGVQHRPLPIVSSELLDSMLCGVSYRGLPLVTRSLYVFPLGRTSTRLFLRLTIFRPLFLFLLPPVPRHVLLQSRPPGANHGFAERAPAPPRMRPRDPSATRRSHLPIASSSTSSRASADSAPMCLWTPRRLHQPVPPPTAPPARLDLHCHTRTFLASNAMLPTTARVDYYQLDHLPFSGKKSTPLPLPSSPMPTPAVTAVPGGFAYDMFSTAYNNVDENVISALNDDSVFCSSISWYDIVVLYILADFVAIAVFSRRGSEAELRVGVESVKEDLVESRPLTHRSVRKKASDPFARAAPSRSRKTVQSSFFRSFVLYDIAWVHAEKVCDLKFYRRPCCA
ncbi:hypothetical protein GGX14DRAFT_558661 [Mycena pura]|uniref:Uncharacterized protein n=1 Tax=Mycena pura TaxID=153505 RepID=A0AAD6YL49_9AGAR|nr:hypothetical protein GGX14DRAFT_558661 [Mycena pura]